MTYSLRNLFCHAGNHHSAETVTYQNYIVQACKYELKAARDAMDVIQGKRRIPIVISLSYGTKRFGEIHRDIPDISPKMFSQELKALEENQLITRTLHDSMPVTVEYALTPLGMSLLELLNELRNWGGYFRKEIVGQ